MDSLSVYLDRYYLDGVVGLLPFGIGDVATAAIALVMFYFSAFVVRSAPLSVAVLANTMVDLALGLLPFYSGNVIDFFYRSNSKNMTLINKYVEGDKEVVSSVRRKVWASAAICFVMLGMIVLLIWAAVRITSWFMSLF